jgi:serine/threonine-protein kinase
MGTPRYMSPEQFRGGPVDARTDVFSAGAVLHELLTGKPPFPGRSFEEVMVKLLYEDLELQPADAMMPEPLRAVVAKALAKTVDDRFDSAAAMAAALRHAASQAPEHPVEAARTIVMHATPAPEDRPPSPPPPPPARDPAAMTDPGLDDRELLATIERRLAQYMGPIAGRLVRNALRDADTLDALCARLADSIDQPPERERFLADVRTRLAGASVSQSGRIGVSASTSGGPVATALSPDEIDRVQQELTRYLGPISKVLVKRALPGATSLTELRGRLAEHLERPDDRAAFLAGR